MVFKCCVVVEYYDETSCMFEGSLDEEIVSQFGVCVVDLVCALRHFLLNYVIFIVSRIQSITGPAVDRAWMDGAPLES